MRGNTFSPTSLESELQESEGTSSKRLASDNFAVVLNIDKTVAKSRQILQESLEVSRKNQERRHQLEERLKHILSLNESALIDVPPLPPELKKPTDNTFHCDPPPRSADIRFLYEQEQVARERAESQLSDLRKRISSYEHLCVQYDKMAEDLKEAREELRKERGKNRDFSEYHVSKEKEMLASVQELEATVRRLKGECEKKEDEKGQLERTLRKSDEQRAELLREAELQRQTVTDLKRLHLRELEEIQKRLEEVAREKSDIERQLRDVRDDQKQAIKHEKESLASHVSDLELKLRDFELKYAQQLQANQDLQLQVKSHCESKQQNQGLVHVFESQMLENTRKIQELQLQLSRTRVEEDSISSEDLTRMVRREQAKVSVLRTRNESQKGKDGKRNCGSAPRRRPTPRKENRTYSKCKYCREG